MITLCGISMSNYYNKVKLQLLEKGVPFTEEVVPTGSQDEAVLAATPLGKVPFVRLDDAARTPLAESAVICDYIEARWPAPALVPADPVAAAKLRELITFLELHVELVARELYGQAFFGGTASEGTKQRVHRQLTRNIPAFKRLARFSPWVAGDSFSLADCAAVAHLPLIGMATRSVFGEDMLAAAGIDWKAYVKRVESRPTAAQVAADRKAATAALMKK